MKTTIACYIVVIAVLASNALAQRIVAPTPVPGAANAPVGLPVQKSNKATTVYRGSKSSVPPVVVQFSSTDVTSVQQMSEDLEIMTHIIDRALSDDFADEDPERMGIKLYLTGSSRSVRSMHIEDFGALFMVKVNFPLQGLPEPKEQVAERPTDSEWARARAQVLGLGEPGDGDFFRGAAVDFDPKRVEALKSVLIRALKNAANIRHLEPQEVVSISVFGSAGRIEIRGGSAPSADAPRTTSSPSSRGSAYSAASAGVLWRNSGTFVFSNSSGGQGTVLTLRVKKSDIDAFAKGEIDEDGFKKTITFNSYAGAGHDITSINSWVNESVAR